MLTSVSALALVVLTVPVQTPLSERPPSIIAPSLPQLTREEERALDERLDRFMKADVGTLTGPAATEAIRDFQKMGMESVPALIRGLNRAATINHTCPALQLSRKLVSLLAKSTDLELLEFARDNIGAGVGDRSRHRGVFQQMRTEILLRRNALARLQPPTRGGRLVTPTTPTTPTTPAPPPELGSRDPRRVITAELVRLARAENGEPLVRVLRELETRRDSGVLDALADRASNSTTDVRELSRKLLLNHLGREDQRSVLAMLEHEKVEVRRAAVGLILDKYPTALPRLIDRVADADDGIRQQVRQALKRAARNLDFGPEPNAEDGEARKARDRWRAYWDLNSR